MTRTRLSLWGPEKAFFISAKAIDSAGNTIEKGDMLSWAVTKDTDNESDAKRAIDGADRGNTATLIAIASGNDAVPGTYSITVTSDDGEASAMVEITVSDAGSMLTLACDPEIVPVRTGETLCTATVTDDNGNIPSNLVSMGTPDDDDRHKVTITVRDKEAQHPVSMRTSTPWVWPGS